MPVFFHIMDSVTFLSRFSANQNACFILLLTDLLLLELAHFLGGPSGDLFGFVCF